MYIFHISPSKARIFFLIFHIIFIYACTSKQSIVQSDIYYLFPCDVNKVNLPNSFFIGDPILSIDQSGRKKLELEIENRSSNPQILQYKAVWIDQKGLSIPTVMSHWNRFVVPMHSKHRIFAIASSLKAWRVEVTILKAQ